jgi:RsiW-degrading membrane proteinase PrsW (M82 family)
MSMSPNLRLALLLSPLVISLGWLCMDAPVSFSREAYFVLLMLAITLGTRTVSWGSAVSALSLGIGVAAPLMVLIGLALDRAGLDLAGSSLASWSVVPILEELVKLVPVFIVAALHTRKTRLTFNPSDWLLVGCAAGAGFAMVENAELVRADAGVLRDMAVQYGPSWLVPGAWGAAGYVGHAAATGMAAAGIGLWKSMARVALVRGAGPAPSRAALALPFAWVTLEHTLTNLRVNTGSSITLMLGNGRLTPWLFLAMVALIVAGDFRLARAVLRHSRTLRVRMSLTREALFGSTLPKRRSLWQRLRVAAGEARLVNATAWIGLERILPGGSK